MTSSSPTDLTVVLEADAIAAAERAATEIATRLTAAVRDHGRATIALSGGSSPRPMFRSLALAPLDWSTIAVFQVDERVVPDASTDRNWRIIQHDLLDPASVPTPSRHPMPVQDVDLAVAANDYGRLLQEHAPRGLDVVHLGLGDDGHTASWPPGDSVVDSTQDVDLVASFRGHQRMTLTPQAINSAHHIIWLVAGESKRAALNSLLASDPQQPAHAVRRFPNVRLFTDEKSESR